MNPWICPRCQQVWAPWVNKCNCVPGGSFATGTNPPPREMATTIPMCSVCGKRNDGMSLHWHSTLPPS